MGNTGINHIFLNVVHSRNGVAFFPNLYVFFPFCIRCRVSFCVCILCLSVSVGEYQFLASHTPTFSYENYFFKYENLQNENNLAGI